MKTMLKNAAFGLYCFIAFCISHSNAQGALLDDVFDNTQTILSKVNNIQQDRLRDDIQPKLDDVQTKVNNVRDTVNDVQNKVGEIRTNVVESVAQTLDIRGRVEDVQGRVQDVGDRVLGIQSDTQELMGNVRDGVAALAGDTLAFVNEAITDVQQKVQEQMDGRDDFLNNQAAPFRADLIAFLTNLEATVNTLSEMTGTNIPFNLTREKAILAGVPDRALFPMYKAFQVAVDFPRVSAQLAELNTNLNAVRTILAEDGLNPGDGQGGGALPSACDLINDNPLLFKYVAFQLRNASWGMQLTAKILESLGENTVPIDAGIHGYAHVTFDTKFVKTFGKIFGKLSDLAGKASDAVGSKISGCELLARHEQLVAGLDGLESDLDALNSLVSSRASQTSLDALGVTVGTLDTSPLDVAVSTRATQAGLDQLAAQVRDQDTVAMRLRIELQLSDPTRHLPLFYLPQSLGGNLGLVRTVVAETITTHENAGLYSGAVAAQELQNGDNAASTNDYRNAFDSYRRAYQDVVRWPVTASIQSGDASGSFDLLWPSDAGGIYCIEYSPDLDGWTSLTPKIIGSDGQSEVALNSSGNVGFYRVYRLSSYDPSVNGS